jgi:radial spoke head protein 4A
MCSPKGYFRSRAGEGELPGEEDDEELAGEDDEPPQAGNDAIQPVKKYKAAMKALANPDLSFWVHHTSHILQQGRTVWWNPSGSKPKQRRTSDFGSEMEDNSEMEEDDEEDEDMEIPGKEVGPSLFRSISEDKAGDGNGPWSLVTSSSVFPEFQVVSVRSNTWPGSYAMCTSKGKVANFYCGDGLKFAPISFCPALSENPAKEYKSGPELEETQDPSVDQEQNWLNKLALKQIEDIEPKFVDNEGGITTGEDDESDYEY